MSNHDVNPEDVLRTFTASLHSGGTLGAIHSSLTYYKEALASKEWSNLSPSNAYQNFMWKKNLVGEIQKLAKEISRIPTEEAEILADLSRSNLSHNGSRPRVFSSKHSHGHGLNKSHQQVGLHNASIPITSSHPGGRHARDQQPHDSADMAEFNKAGLEAA